MTVRRDALQVALLGVTMGAAKMGVGQGRMRFVSGFAQFITGAGYIRPVTVPYFRHIRGFIAGAISGIRLARTVTLPPYFTRREPI
jgi:membrane associated rhomboid family serine protease